MYVFLVLVSVLMYTGSLLHKLYKVRFYSMSHWQLSFMTFTEGYVSLSYKVSINYSLEYEYMITLYKTVTQYFEIIFI